jgi:hypothetical protein
MTLADIWKYVKGNIQLVEIDGTTIPAYDNHKYMTRVVNVIKNSSAATLIYLA